MTVLRRPGLTLALLALSLVAALCGSVPLIEDLSDPVPAADAHPYGYLAHCSTIHNTQGPGSYPCHNDVNAFNITTNWDGNCSVINGLEQCATATTSCSSTNRDAHCPTPSTGVNWTRINSIATATTGQTIASVTIPPCSSTAHSHAAGVHPAGVNNESCHGHSCTWYLGGSNPSHASWLNDTACPSTPPPPTTTTTTTTTTLPPPPGCSSGLHSHTSDGVGCHGHSVVPSTCGASYQTINGAGHIDRDVSSVPPCDAATPPVVSVTGETVDERAGSATFTVTLSKTWTSTVHVDVDTSNATARAGDDYTAVNRRVSVSVGATSVAVPVTILDDTSHESDESFTLTLSNPSNASLSVTPSATTTIRDDDTAPPDAVQNLALTCTATSVNPLEFTLSATWDAPVNGAVNVQAELTENPDVGWWTINGAATSPYTANVPAAGSYRTNVIPYLTGGIQGVSSEAFAECAVPVVSIAALTPVVDEGGWLRYTLSMAPASAAPVTVYWGTTNAGEATAGTDYTARSDIVTFAAGQTTKTVTVQTLTDLNSPESDETVIIELSSADVATIGTGTATGTIRDVAPPVVSLTSTALTVAETNAAGVQITAVLDKPAPAAASVVVTATGAARGAGSCYAGVEYYLSASSFSFSVGDSSATITLYPCSDTDYNNETINVNLSNVSFGRLTFGSPTTTVVTITDTTPPPGPGTVTVTVTAPDRLNHGGLLHPETFVAAVTGFNCTGFCGDGTGPAARIDIIDFGLALTATNGYLREPDQAAAGTGEYAVIQCVPAPTHATLVAACAAVSPDDVTTSSRRVVVVGLFYNATLEAATVADSQRVYPQITGFTGTYRYWYMQNGVLTSATAPLTVNAVSTAGTDGQKVWSSLIEPD